VSAADLGTPHPQSRDFFEVRYRESSDPWGFATSSYEQDRYRATLAALKQPVYRHAYEPGCSVGVLTAALAARCRRVSACDIAAEAVALARKRCKRFSHVSIVQADAAVPPDDAFDLIIFSEIGYYFDAARLRELALALADVLQPGGEFVAVHWLGHSADHVLHGDEVHAVLRAALPCEWIAGERHAGFRIDSWRRPA
jgi:SAM-dependent methyltransferase